MEEEIKKKKIKKAKIDKRPYYYTEDEVELVVSLKDRKDDFKVSVKLIKATLDVLYKRKEELQKEIDINEAWLNDVKDDLAQIKYFKFEE